MISLGGIREQNVRVAQRGGLRTDDRGRNRVERHAMKMLSEREGRTRLRDDSELVQTVSLARGVYEKQKRPLPALKLALSSSHPRPFGWVKGCAPRTQKCERWVADIRFGFQWGCTSQERTLTTTKRHAHSYPAPLARESPDRMELRSARLEATTPGWNRYSPVDTHL